MSFETIDRRADVSRHAIGATRIKGYRFDTPDAVVLHQMGFSRGGGAAQYDAVCAHFAVLRSGLILYLHNVDELLHASNGLNNRGIAIEFEGALPSERMRWHRAVPASQQVLPTHAQIHAGRHLINSLIRNVGISFVFAHRQANGDTKSNCPGPHIWYNIGQYFVTAGTLSDGGDGYTYSRGSRTGIPLPESWRDAEFAI